jgi:MFS family permease
VVTGARFLWGHPALRTLAVSIFVMNVTFGADISVLVIYSTRHLHAGAAGYGALLTAIAVGGLVFTPFTSRMVRRFGMPWLLRIGLTIEALTHLGLALAPSLGVAYAVMVVFGMHDGVWNVTTSSLRQQETPDGMQGRTAATNAMFSVGGHTIGAFLGGIEVASCGVVAPYWIGAVVVSGLVVIAWRPFGHTQLRA